MKTPLDGDPDEDERAVDAVHAAMYKALRQAESRDKGSPPSDQAVIAWRTAIEAIEEGSSEYVAILTLGLRDADGQELPAEARCFFLGLIARLIENKKRRHPPRREVRVVYKIFHKAELLKGPGSRPSGVSAADEAMDKVSKIYNCSVSTIDEIVRPRASRPQRKRIRVLGEPD